MYCVPHQLKVWWGHCPTCHTYSPLHALQYYTSNKIYIGKLIFILHHWLLPFFNVESSKYVYSHDKNLFWARNREGREGFVPASHVIFMDEDTPINSEYSASSGQFIFAIWVAKCKGQCGYYIYSQRCTCRMYSYIHSGQCSRVEPKADSEADGKLMLRRVRVREAPGSSAQGATLSGCSSGREWHSARTSSVRPPVRTHYPLCYYPRISASL